MSYPYPSVDDFKDYFTRDFPYQPAPPADQSNAFVQDADIAKAQVEASFNFNPDFASSEDQFDLLFNYLTAHYLVIDLRNASQGVAGKFAWSEQSKTVGSVSQSFAIPQMILDNPSLSLLTTTTYGAKYLQLIFPQTVGVMTPICGWTKP